MSRDDSNLARDFIQNNLHVFDPGNRAHWEKPRCKICKEFEDHPIHKENDGTLPASGGGRP